MAESWEAYVPRRQEEEEVLLPNWCLIKCLQSSAAATDGDLVSWPIIHQLFLMSIVKKRKKICFPCLRLSPFSLSLTTPGSRSNLFILINYLIIYLFSPLLILKKLGVLDRVFLFSFSNGPNSPYFEEEKKVEIAIF